MSAPGRRAGARRHLALVGSRGRIEREVVLLALSGELDLDASEALRSLETIVVERPGARVLVDLTEVSFVGSIALDAFTQACRRASASGGAVSFHGASPFATRLLEIWRLEPAPGPAPPSGGAATIGSRHSEPLAAVPDLEEPRRRVVRFAPPGR